MQMQHDCLVRALGSSSSTSLAVAEGGAPAAEAAPASRELRLVITRSRKADAWLPTLPRAGLAIRHAGAIALSAEGVRVLGATEESKPGNHPGDGKATGRASTRRMQKMGRLHARQPCSGQRGHRSCSAKRGRARTAQRVVILGGDVAMLQVHHQVVLRACKRNRKRASAPEMPFWATSRSRVSREARRGRGVRTVKRSTPAETAAASRSMER